MKRKRGRPSLADGGIKKERTRLSAAQYDALMCAYDESTKGEDYYRDLRIAFELMWETGARIGEVIGGRQKYTVRLKNKDKVGNVVSVSEEDRESKINMMRVQQIIPRNEKYPEILLYTEKQHGASKNEPRWVPITPSFYKRLREFAKGKKPEEQLFQFIPSRATISRILQRCGVDAGILHTKVYPHLMRHSFTDRMLDLKLPTPIIARLLGHKHIATVEKYVTDRTSFEARKLMFPDEENKQ